MAEEEEEGEEIENNENRKDIRQSEDNERMFIKREKEGLKKEGVKEKDADEKEKSGKKKNSKVEARMQKRRKQLQNKREMLGIPWGPDPCVTLRVTMGKQPAAALTSIKGCQFPWYVPPRKYEDIKRDEEILDEIERQDNAEMNIQRFKDNNKRFLKRLYLMSKEVERQRKWEANKPIGSEITYKEYRDKMKIKMQKKELQRQERERVTQIENKVERKLKQQEEGTRKGKKNISKLKLFPRWYPMTVIPEFVYTLQLIEKEQNKLQSCKGTKSRSKNKTAKDSLVNEFTSFVDELRTVCKNLKLSRMPP